MILLDLSPTIYSTFLATHAEGADVDENFLRHLILNSIRSYLVKFRNEYGELVICTDSKGTWRKDIFPYYKASRKASRDSSTYNWPRIFEAVENIKNEIRDNFPYKFISVPQAEADDIVGILSKRFNTTEKILIISVDKDFMQLQVHQNVNQYDPVRKTFLYCADAVEYLRTHILIGDRGDGIPNFLSDDDTFVNKLKRQKPLHKKKVETWITINPQDFCDENMLRNYMRNKMLVDFEEIPEKISSDIHQAYDASIVVKKDLYPYFLKNKLNNLVNLMGDF